MIKCAPGLLFCAFTQDLAHQLIHESCHDRSMNVVWLHRAFTHLTPWLWSACCSSPEAGSQALLYCIRQRPKVSGQTRHRLFSPPLNRRLQVSGRMAGMHYGGHWVRVPASDTQSRALSHALSAISLARLTSLCKCTVALAQRRQHIQTEAEGSGWIERGGRYQMCHTSARHPLRIWPMSKLPIVPVVPVPATGSAVPRR